MTTKIEIRGGVAKGSNRKRGHILRGYALVNDDIAEVVNRYSWHFDKRGYPMGTVDGKDIRLHCFVYKTLYGFGCEKDEEIDHIDRDKLNALDGNLRRVTRSFNRANSDRSKNNTSGYIGVEKRPETGRWRAKIQVKRERINLGNYDDPLEAARAVNEGYRKYFPGVVIPNPSAEIHGD